MKKTIVGVLALLLLAIGAAVAQAVVPADTPSSSWTWNEGVPGTPVAAPDIAVFAANQSGVDARSIRSLVSGRSGDGSLAVLAARDRDGHVCLSYTRDNGAVADLFHCLVGEEANKPVVLYASGGGASPGAVDWASVSGVVRADVARVTLTFSDGSQRDLALNAWRAFAYYADSAAAMPAALLAFRSDGTQVADFDLHSLPTPLYGS